MSDLTPCPREDCKATDCEKMLDAVLPELLAKAWDEGWDVGWDEHVNFASHGELGSTRNPYRKAKQ